MSLDIIKYESVASIHHLIADFLPSAQFDFIARLKSRSRVGPPPETRYMCPPVL